jgi:hypothetical protein
MKTFDEHWAQFEARNPSLTYTSAEKAIAGLGYTWGMCDELQRNINKLTTRVALLDKEPSHDSHNKGH